MTAQKWNKNYTHYARLQMCRRTLLQLCIYTSICLFSIYDLYLKRVCAI